jgi:hypothetical protein
MPEAEKMATFVGALPNQSGVGKPPKNPGVPAPTVGTKGVPALKAKDLGMGPPPGQKADRAAPDSSATSPTTSTGSGSGRVGTAAHRKQAFLESGLSPLLFGAAGAGGGYMAGKHIINPLLEMKERALREKIRSGQKILSGLERSRSAAPFVAGAVGAIILATLAARKARADERAKIETRQFWQDPANQGLLNEFQGAQAGFLPGEQATFGQQMPFY